MGQFFKLSYLCHFSSYSHENQKARTRTHTDRSVLITDISLSQFTLYHPFKTTPFISMGRGYSG